MAFYDNKLWLLSHIHNSFISSDDTGVCEMVMGGGGFREELEVVARTQGLTSYLPVVLAGEEEEDEQGRGSPDIKAGPGRRERAATTALQLQQKLARDEKGAQGRSVTWRAGEQSLEEEELFPKREVARAVPVVSLLAQRLESLEPGAGAPWQQYSVWEGAHYREAVVRRLQVFPVLGEGEGGPPLHISVSREAKVRQVVGLVCWRYTQEERLPALQAGKGPEDYELFMCEEDGSVDRDFPCLDWRETFSKYGFLQLALVPRQGGPEEGQHRVTLHLPDGSFTELCVERSLLSLGDLLQLGLQKRRRTLAAASSRDVPLKYHLEAAEGPGVALEAGAALASCTGNEFYIVRSNSKRPSGPRDREGGEHLNIYEVHLFQSFDVQMITKVRTKVDIHLGISGEKVKLVLLLSRIYGKFQGALDKKILSIVAPTLNLCRDMMFGISASFCPSSARKSMLIATNSHL